jgi:hypothetical protein
LNAENLASAITASLNSGALRARAAEIGAAIRGEPDGVMEAVRLIEKSI